jgi:hypothetical protein
VVEALDILVVVQVLVAREAQVIRVRRIGLAMKLEEQQQHACDH